MQQQHLEAEPMMIHRHEPSRVGTLDRSETVPTLPLQPAASGAAPHPTLKSSVGTLGSIVSAAPFSTGVRSRQSSYHRLDEDKGAVPAPYSNQYQDQQEQQQYSPRRRRYCCCFTTRSACILVVLGSIFLILAGLGLAVFFLFPRMPVVTVGKPHVPVGSSSADGLVVSGRLSRASPSEPFTLSISMQVDVAVYSPNYEDIAVSTIDLNANLLDASGTRIPGAVAKGSQESIVFTHQSNTTFSITVSMGYSTTNPHSAGTVITDPTLAVLADSCGNNPSRPLDFTYTVTVAIDAIKWTGYSPSFDGRLTYDCPRTSDGLSLFDEMRTFF